LYTPRCRAFIAGGAVFSAFSIKNLRWNEFSGWRTCHPSRMRGDLELQAGIIANELFRRGPLISSDSSVPTVPQGMLTSD